tara:strand:+ start:5389 stop:5745 length:357 start_codon:yes stop_codon:yes gene_type:complete
MTSEQKRTILAELVKGENGAVHKAELDIEATATLNGFVGEELDCLFEFSRTQKTGEQDAEGTDIFETITEKMYCNMLVETEGAYMTDRDRLSNYDGTEVDEDGENILNKLQAKETITI